jgi:hypothetical protein
MKFLNWIFNQQRSLMKTIVQHVVLNAQLKIMHIRWWKVHTRKNIGSHLVVELDIKDRGDQSNNTLYLFY